MHKEKKANNKDKNKQKKACSLSHDKTSILFSGGDIFDKKVDRKMNKIGKKSGESLFLIP